MSRIHWDSHHGPAINVKDHVAYPHDLPEDEFMAIYQMIQESFWDRAEQIAKEHGYAGVWSEGRMGGWLVPYYSGRRALDKIEALPGERITFGEFGECISNLLDECRLDFLAELDEAIKEKDEKARLLELGTPSRGY